MVVALVSAVENSRGWTPLTVAGPANEKFTFVDPLVVIYDALASVFLVRDMVILLFDNYTLPVDIVWGNFILLMEATGDGWADGFCPGISCPICPSWPGCGGCCSET